MLNLITSSRYFIVQSFLLLVYIPIRYYYLNKSILNAPEWLGYTRESVLTSIFTVFMIMRYKRYYTVEHFLTVFFFFGKICVMAIIQMAGNYTVLAYYCAACLFAWLMIKPKGYKGKSNLIDITDKQFNQILDNKQNRVNGSYIFLVAYAPFSETCFTVNL